MSKPIYQQIPITHIASKLPGGLGQNVAREDVVSALLRSLGAGDVAGAFEGLGLDANPADGTFFAVEIGDVAHVAFIPTGMTILQAAHQFFRDGQFEKGISFLETMTRESPPDTDTLYNLGLAYNVVERYDEAVIRLSRALERRPLSPQILNALGLAYFKLGKLQAAEGVLRRALEVEPGNFLSLKNLGGTLGEMKQYGQALECFRSAHAIEPQDQAVCLGLAMSVASLKESASKDDVDLAYRACQALLGQAEVDSRTRESAQNAISALSAMHLRRNSGSVAGLRLDVVEYLTHWIRVLDRIDDPKTRNQAILEAAEISNKGVDISNPDVKHDLTILGTSVTGLSVVCLVYAGVRRINPDMDVGIDFSREMEIAQANARV